MSAEPGIVPPPEDMDLARFACMLRDAARASSRDWARQMDQHERDRAVRYLDRVLWDLRTVTARLAARFRLQAVSEQKAAAFVRAAAVHSAAQTLGQSWLIIEAVPPAGPTLAASDGCRPADLMCYAAMRAAAWRKPVTGLEQVTQPLAEALAALASGAGQLSAGAPQPQAALLTAAQACLGAAATQLSGIQPSRHPRISRSRAPGTALGHPRYPAESRAGCVPPPRWESPC